MLSGLVRKRPTTETAGSDHSDRSAKKPCATSTALKSPTSSAKSTIPQVSSSSEPAVATSNNGGLYCIGILPGIGKYADSSDSEKSTDTDEDYDYSSYDWVGRKVKKDHHDHSNCGGSH